MSSKESGITISTWKTEALFSLRLKGGLPQVGKERKIRPVLTDGRGRVIESGESVSEGQSWYNLFGRRVEGPGQNDTALLEKFYKIRETTVFATLGSK